MSDSEDWGNSDEENVWKKGGDDEDDWDREAPKEPVAAADKASDDVSKPAASAKKVDVYVPLDNPAEEKNRLKRLQEDAEGSVCDDLFSGFTVSKPASSSSDGITPASTLATVSASTPSILEKSTSSGAPSGAVLASGVSNSTTSTAAHRTPSKKRDDVQDAFFDDFHFESQKEIGQFVQEMLSKIEAVEKKAHMRGSLCNFLIKLLSCASEKLTFRDCEELEKKAKDIIRDKKQEVQRAQQVKTKINAVNKNTKWDVNDALNERYGEDWDDYDEENAGEWAEGGDWGQGNWSGEWDEKAWGPKPAADATTPAPTPAADPTTPSNSTAAPPADSTIPTTAPATTAYK